MILFLNTFIVINVFKNKNLLLYMFRLLPVLLTLALIIPIILQYTLHLHIIQNNKITISIYGIYLLIYLLIQFAFAYFNNLGYYNIKKESRLNQNTGFSQNLDTISKPLINLIVVGYKEDPTYYKMCLESIKTSFSNILNLNKVFVIIDGNDPEDQYMIDSFLETFTENSIHINLINHETSDELFITNHIYDINNNDIICISQKHHGKRSAMFTGFQLSLLEKNLYNKNIETVFCTDSDTTITPECLNVMFKQFENIHVGAVVGNLAIYNKYDSTISFLSSIRYWYAFNLERAYQSFTGSVLCVSGPIGMYRLSSLEKIVQSWKNQTFLGKKCTYGDDRHLSNKILGLKEHIIYTPLAYAETETPTDIYRFYKQQVRWNKSSFREFFWNVFILHNHSLFMTVDIIYVLVYPYVVMSYLLYVLWTGTVFELGLYFCILFSLGIVKSTYGYFISGKFENMFYFLYSAVYICIVFPAKIWALININDNSWGTSTRKILKNDVSIDISIPILWNIVLLSGFISNINRTINNNTPFNDYMLLIIPCSLWIFFFLTLSIYIYIKRKNVAGNLHFDKNS